MRIPTLPFSITVFLLFCGLWSTQGAEPQSGVRSLDDTLHHIRNGDDREWSDFPQTAQDQSYELRFQAMQNEQQQTIQLTQIDIKQTWNISLNEAKLGRLHRDENSTVGYWSVPAGTLADGENILRIETSAKDPDDVSIGHVYLHDRAMDTVLNAAKLQVTVRDDDGGHLLPCRITIVRNSSLMTVGATSTDDMAVRPGVVYCKGQADFGLPSGTYQIIGGRGPEYSIASQKITINDNDSLRLEFTLRRTVPTDGFVACDTHIHTRTHSGHGDSTVKERLLTLAGEAIELPIATDHNVHVAYAGLATELGLQPWFTPVVGNEVTTKRGHFNVFPVASVDTPVPDHAAKTWDILFADIFKTPNVKIAILNHARDIHSNFRPFGPEHHIAQTGQNLDGRRLQANAMEVINSGAQQTDIMTLVHDWMGLLNAGQTITPVGSSDSHDVARYIVGQGRTYIRCDDTAADKIHVADAVQAFVQGRVTVSCGLNADIRINETYRVGDTVAQADHYVAEIDVKGPAWIEADRVEVFVNGQSVHVRTLPDNIRARPGIKTTLSVDLPISPRQDAFVVAVVSGPGVTSLHWPIGKPYQPTSPDWTPRCLAVTGAIWIDADGDGKRTSANQYAAAVCQQADNAPAKIIELLEPYDRAVALHAAARLMAIHETDFLSNILPLAADGSDSINEAFRDYRDLWRQSQRARVGIPPK